MQKSIWAAEHEDGGELFAIFVPLLRHAAEQDRQVASFILCDKVLKQEFVISVTDSIGDDWLKDVMLKELSMGKSWGSLT